MQLGKQQFRKKMTMKSIEERKKAAKAYRKTTSRSDLGIWKTETKRTVVEELLLMQEKTRLRELIPIRRERMSASPFSFFRGSAILQAHEYVGNGGTSNWSSTKRVTTR